MLITIRIAIEKGKAQRKFDSDKLKENFALYFPAITETVTLGQTKSNMEAFCEECGINFYFRKSVPNSRIKGLVMKDEDGRVFLFMSDLFKCVERYWFTFLHELQHIIAGDLDEKRVISLEENETKIDQDVISLLVKQDMDEEREYNLTEIKKISRKNGVPIGLVAEIARYRSGNYTDYSIYQLVHYVKDSEIS